MKVSPKANTLALKILHNIKHECTAKSSTWEVDETLIKPLGVRSGANSLTVKI
jgi:hypothetical protein